MTVSCEYCLLLGRDRAMGRSLVKRFPTEYGVSGFYFEIR